MRESSSAITQCLACEASARHNATCPSIFGILMPPLQTAARPCNADEDTTVLA